MAIIDGGNRQHHRLLKNKKIILTLNEFQT